MKRNMAQAYMEVNEILKYLPKEKVEKVPLEYRNLFENCHLDNYEVNIDPNKPIEEQKIVYETRVILTVLKYNYWCASDEERRKMQEQMREVDRQRNAKYDISELTQRKNVQTFSEVRNENLPVESVKESWLSKIISKFKRIFKH